MLEYVCECVYLNMLYLFMNPNFHSYKFVKALFVLPCQQTLLKEQINLSFHQYNNCPYIREKHKQESLK